MNLFDDFSNSQSDFLTSTFSNVFQTFATDTLQRNGLISKGPAPMGNPLPNQSGAPAPAYVANTSGLQRSQGFGVMGMDSTTTMMLIGGIVVIGLVLFLKK